MNNREPFILDNKTIKNGGEPFLIAELSGNHKGDLARAKKLMEEAKKGGFDALKLQYFTADDMTLSINENEFMVRGGLWDGRSLHEIFTEGALPEEWLKPLFDYAQDIGIYIFSSVFSARGLDVLESLNCPAYKIASFEAMDIPLIQAVARTQKPLIVSTGIIDDVGMEDVVNICEQEANTRLAFMHCISDYPAPYSSFNLVTLRDMTERFSYPIGLSDHSLDEVAAVSSVSLGACMIEKHITVSCDDGAIDSQFSLPISKFEAFVNKVRAAHVMQGEVAYKSSSPRKNYRSLYAVKDIEQGELFSEDNVRSIRPGHGLEPKHFNKVLNKKSTCLIKKGTALSWDMINLN